MNLPVDLGDLVIFFVKLLTKFVNLTKLDLNGVEDVKVYECYFYLQFFLPRLSIFRRESSSRSRTCLFVGQQF